MDEAERAAIALLAEDVGTWDATLEIRMAPNAEPNTTTGVAIDRIVGGRWLVSDISTDTGFEGHGVYGWNSGVESFVGVWVDSAGDGIAESTGTWDPESGTLSYETAVAYEGQTIVYREITHRIDDDTREYRNLMPAPDGSEYEAIKATYRRRT